MAKANRPFNSISMFGVFIFVKLILIPAKAQLQLGFTPPEEVKAMHEVATELGKKDWIKLNSDPCSNDSTWTHPYTIGSLYNNSVECDCSYPGGVCHIIHLFVKGQDLSGNLPKGIAKLPYLKMLDLSMNCFTGNIPPEWASTNLEYLSLYVNNLTGRLPGYLGNITSLTYLSVENNRFTGTVPPEIGKLRNLEHLILSANNFTGKLPSSLSKLTRLTELRISSNNFVGRIPDFISSWKSLEMFWILASGFDGPIPQSISGLTNLTDLRITDLKGEGSKFPPLENLKNIIYLILRDCNLTGPIASYIMQMRNLKFLDLSFNRLQGNLPTNYDNLVSLEKMHLTSNWLSGSIPDWFITRDSRYDIDVSYNNFTESSLPTTCRETLNLFKSTRTLNKTEAVECLDNYVCSKEQYSLHINCGGSTTTIGDVVYEGDQEPGGPAKYIPTKDRWAVSTSGHFWDVQSSSDAYIAHNISVLKMNNSELYKNARLSPLSLTYYVRCLANGNYTVNLHFAEIVIRDNRSFYSVGRRAFDVYIQDKLVLKDFDIIKTISMADKVFIHTSRAVVRNSTLEIHFYWAGIGTTTSPRRGVYGPLISAIDVVSDFKPPDKNKRAKLIIASVVVPVVLFIFIIAGTVWWKCLLGGKTSGERELVGLDLQTGIFSFRQIKAATNNFDPSNKIGEGGFGAVYKGTLSDGTLVAVKQLSSKSRQGNREFLNEIGMISALQHPNLVRLYGCCVEGNQLLLVYEYMENNSLARALFDKGDGQSLKLDWRTRKRICVGIAKGLAFLHEESALKIVHRDIKTTNVLLDGDLSPKISDFGLAKLDEEENTHISTRVAGTIGYMAPEYALYGYLTHKADVYSFGVVGLEIVVGQSNMKYQPGEDYVCLLDYALVLRQKGNLLELVDPRLGSQFNQEELIRMIKIALLCTNPSPALRPTMSKVVSMLEGQTAVEEVTMDESVHENELRFTAMRNLFEHRSHGGVNESQLSGGSASESRPLVIHSDVIWDGSSTNSTQDVYLCDNISV